MSAVRVAVVDIGTNSTRLLVAEVADAHGPAPAFRELARHSNVTRLGEGLERTGRLDAEAMERVHRVMASYRAEVDRIGVDGTTGVLTSAVREAANGPAFVREVRQRHGFDVRTISGDEEAHLTYRGATAGRPDADRAVVVIDVGGGSTEIVVGRDGEVAFHVSTRAGVVRQSERHLHADPPTAAEIAALAADVEAILAAEVPAEARAGVVHAIGVAGTATSIAAIDQALEPYDPARVHSYVVPLATADAILARLAGMTEPERRSVPGLHPDRAPTILAGVVILSAAVRAFGLDRFEVSEADLLRGEALRFAARAG